MTLTSLRESYQRLSSREQRLLLLLALLFVLLAAFFIYSQGSSLLSSLRTQNRSLYQSLDQLQTKREAYGRAKQTREALERRLRAPALDLFSYLDNMPLVQKTTPRPAPEDKGVESLGNDIRRKSVKLHLASVELMPLLQFLRDLQADSEHLVQVTQLTLQNTDDQHKTFSVDLLVSVYEKTPKPAGTST